MSRRALGCVIELLETVILAVLVFLGIQAFVAQPFRVQQDSMEPTVLPDQYVLVDKLTPRLTGYARGDIVVFESPPDWVDHGTPFIKRVVGLPGERLEIRDGGVLVDGRPIAEPYLAAGVRTEPRGPETAWVVPPGKVFVMGDNRGDSADSRVFGAVPIGSIAGRAWLRYWPPGALALLGGGPIRAGIAAPSPAPGAHAQGAAP